MTPLGRGVARFAGWNIGPKSQHSEDTAVAGHKITVHPMDTRNLGRGPCCWSWSHKALEGSVLLRFLVHHLSHWEKA